MPARVFSVRTRVRVRSGFALPFVILRQSLHALVRKGSARMPLSGAWNRRHQQVSALLLACMCMLCTVHGRRGSALLIAPLHRLHTSKACRQAGKQWRHVGNSIALTERSGSRWFEWPASASAAEPGWQHPWRHWSPGWLQWNRWWGGEGGEGLGAVVGAALGGEEEAVKLCQHLQAKGVMQSDTSGFNSAPDATCVHAGHLIGLDGYAG